MFFGAATAGDGRVVFAPSNANGVGVFDPTDDSFILVDISGEFSGMSVLAGTTTAGDGRVVFAPSNADGVGIFAGPCAVQAVEKFPRVALTDYTTAGYTASSSADAFNTAFATWKAFDGGTDGWHSGSYNNEAIY